MNGHSSESGFKCVSCGRVIISKGQTTGSPCSCCEHITWFSHDYSERFSSPEQNRRILSDLRNGLNILLTQDKPQLDLATLLVPYIPTLGRHVYDTWEYSGGLHEFGNVLGRGLPICEIKELRTDSSFVELWLSDNGAPSLIQGSLQRRSERSERWQVILTQITFQHDVVQHHSKELVDKCWKSFCEYADHSIRIEMFTDDEIKTFFRDFYRHASGSLSNLCEFAFNYILHDIIDLSKRDAELLKCARASLEDNAIDWYSILILEHVGEKETVLKCLARDLKAGRLGSDESSKRYRGKMHTLGAKQVLGWCPCDECSSSYRAGCGTRIKKKRFKT